MCVLTFTLEGMRKRVFPTYKNVETRTRAHTHAHTHTHIRDREGGNKKQKLYTYLTRETFVTIKFFILFVTPDVNIRI